MSWYKKEACANWAVLCTISGQNVPLYKTHANIDWGYNNCNNLSAACCLYNLCSATFLMSYVSLHFVWSMIGGL